MSSSRIEDVTKFVRVCVCVCIWSHFVSFQAFKAFKARCFERVERVSQGCLFKVSRVFGSFKDVSMKV